MTTTPSSAKPIIGIMGEFSAGKSTLSNLLIGADHLPQKVTATRLPPVKLSYGDEQIVRVLDDGSEEVQHVDDLGEVPFEGTQYIKCFIKAPILESFDLIDFPGISDPNLPMSQWEDMVEDVSAVIWCTHSTQSWRQSEVGVWESVPKEIRDQSILLITRFDKLKTDLEKKRVFARVKNEAGHLFHAIYPVALLHALNSERGSAKWAASGAENLFNAVERMAGLAPATRQPSPQAAASADQSVAPSQSAPAAAEAGPRILPRRVKAGDGGGRERPPARSDSERKDSIRGLLS